LLSHTQRSLASEYYSSLSLLLHRIKNKLFRPNGILSPEYSTTTLAMAFKLAFKPFHNQLFGSRQRCSGMFAAEPYLLITYGIKVTNPLETMGGGHQIF
jgi:hypothetical protein